MYESSIFNRHHEIRLAAPEDCCRSGDDSFVKSNVNALERVRAGRVDRGASGASVPTEAAIGLVERRFGIGLVAVRLHGQDGHRFPRILRDIVFNLGGLLAQLRPSRPRSWRRSRTADWKNGEEHLLKEAGSRRRV